MKIEDIKVLTDEELSQKLYSLKEELFHLRRKKSVGQLEHPEQVRIIRKDIARVLTIQKERSLGIK
jgi:large subunit ribosomal protein L29